MADDHFETLSDRISSHRLKTLKVVCQRQVQEVGQLIVEAPPGIAFDRASGTFCPDIGLELLGPPVTRAMEVCRDKVINQGVVRVRLVDLSEVPPCIIVPHIEVPFFAVTECPGAQPGDNIQKHDVTAECASLSAVCSVGPCCSHKPSLLLSIVVVVQLCLVVARETIIKVEGAEPFCQ